MSIFKVEVVKINSINPHPNVDRLDIASYFLKVAVGCVMP